VANQKSRLRILTKNVGKLPLGYELALSAPAGAAAALGGDTKGRDIHDDHNKGKKVQPHQQSYCRMHRQNATKPKPAGFFYPNENWVTHLKQTDRNSE
jgi:hypothetical protein